MEKLEISSRTLYRNKRKDVLMKIIDTCIKLLMKEKKELEKIPFAVFRKLEKDLEELK